mgnify:CR=1 FL=1
MFGFESNPPVCDVDIIKLISLDCPAAIVKSVSAADSQFILGGLVIFILTFISFLSLLIIFLTLLKNQMAKIKK